MKDDEVTIKLVLKPLADDVPVDVRLARLLKTALRRYGFKCLECREEKAEPLQSKVQWSQPRREQS